MQASVAAGTPLGLQLLASNQSVETVPVNVRSTAYALWRGKTPTLATTSAEKTTVDRRLAVQHGSAASLTIHSTPGEGTTVAIRLPAVFAGAEQPARRAV